MKAAARISVVIVTFTLSTLWQCTDAFASLVPNYYNENLNQTLLRVKRQGQQRCTDGFQCKTTQECIDVDKQCNGALDCSDGSDEYESLCKEQICPGYLFRCDYGGCISSDQRCDGVKDCKDNSDEIGCATQEKINTNCRSDEFECANGQCIESDKKCNGLAECEDKSDESEELCLNIYCPGYTYKCAYGACVDGDAECNGVQNCLDNSDEKSCAPTPTPPTKPTRPPDGASNMCITPKQPENGQWIHYSTYQPGPEGERIPKSSIIIFKCNSGFKLSSTNEESHLVLCEDDGKWALTEMPHCEKLCPPRYNSPSTIIQCKNIDTGSLLPCDKATHGTVLTFKCAPYYEPDSSRSRRNCYNGEWDYPPPTCTPVCGEKRVNATPLVVNGMEVERGNYPWVTAIYSNKDQSPKDFINVCGGSLLTTALVLTAAHCVASQKNGKPYNVRYYKVAVGKYYNPYMDPRDNDTAQYTDVEKIEVNQEYKGEVQNFRGDIAILKLKKPFALSKVVQPVCFQDITEYSPQPFTLGVITGWGYTQAEGKVADALKELEIPYKDDSTCESEFDEEWFATYFLSDKMCAGYLNRNTSVCKGDSGGGLVFKHPRKKRFFVHGIVSLGRTIRKDNVDQCDIQKSALFTRVETYFEWLQSKISFLSYKTDEDTQVQG